MILNGNKNQPAKPPTKEAIERSRKARNKRKTASKIVYRYVQSEKPKHNATVMNIFWFSGIDGVFSVFKANAAIDNKIPVRKYKVKKLAMDFCRKANIR